VCGKTSPDVPMAVRVLYYLIWHQKNIDNKRAIKLLTDNTKERLTSNLRRCPITTEFFVVNKEFKSEY
jgi:hypothetical protein